LRSSDPKIKVTLPIRDITTAAKSNSILKTKAAKQANTRKTIATPQGEGWLSTKKKATTKKATKKVGVSQKKPTSKTTTKKPIKKTNANLKTASSRKVATSSKKPKAVDRTMKIASDNQNNNIRLVRHSDVIELSSTDDDDELMKSDNDDEVDHHAVNTFSSDSEHEFEG
jgi:hypothetical protein